MKKEVTIKQATKYLEKAVQDSINEYQKSIDNKKDPVIKQTRQDIKDLQEIEAKLWRFEQVYGAKVQIVFPEKFPDFEIKKFLKKLSK